MASLFTLSLAVPALCFASLLAPFQCGGSDEPEAATRLEDTPGEALYRLAVEFDKAGDRPGRVRVLKHLVDRYPKSRFAKTAHEDLIALGELPAGSPPPGDRDVPPADPSPPDPAARGGDTAP